MAKTDYIILTTDESAGGRFYYYADASGSNAEEAILNAIEQETDRPVQIDRGSSIESFMYIAVPKSNWNVYHERYP